MTAVTAQTEEGRDLLGAVALLSETRELHGNLRISASPGVD
jgi:hypothetical protein